MADEMIQAKNATLSIAGTSFELVSTPLFLGEESDEITRQTWGTRGDVYVGGRKRYQQLTFTCRIGFNDCYPDVDVGCNAAIIQTVTYGTGKCDDDASDVTCTVSYTALVVSITPGTVEPQGDPTFTIVLRPQYTPAPAYS